MDVGALGVALICVCAVAAGVYLAYRRFKHKRAKSAIYTGVVEDDAAASDIVRAEEAFRAARDEEARAGDDEVSDGSGKVE